ncbi:hypothetical protein K6959_13225 [Bacillus aquiflavi]|uniref:hypothetical protein n=1 Tax=Bacillus aquiflavi TaxID=2672567 RepID=UPI001CA9E71A|nr:hypothetical protein [Bacillus aquiflavi]UAC47615.1 hypothetical protein K6959_13225 [Bacillus aquiflavi]
MLQKYEKRFFTDPPNIAVEVEDQWIKKVITAYYHYFIVVLTNKLAQQSAEQQLINALHTLLPNKVKLKMEVIEEGLKEIFYEKGWYFLGGRTSPHYGPYIWRVMEKKTYDVELPNGIETVDVYFMDDFIMLSWLHFATFGNLYAGGWAKENGLYCVASGYKTDSDSFLNSYLKHEAQHFNDYKLFPNLLQNDLEYRAKLVELIYYPDFTIFEKFLTTANKNEESPHSYSAFKIIEAFSFRFFRCEKLEMDIKKWKGLDYKTIQQFARQLYDQHTNLLIDQGLKQKV